MGMFTAVFGTHSDREIKRINPIVDHVMALEEEYDVEIPTDDLENIATVGDVINFLKDKGIEG